MGYFGVRGASDRWWRFGCERRWGDVGEKRADGERERVGATEGD
jgi:hypothetical protein